MVYVFLYGIYHLSAQTKTEQYLSHKITLHENNEVIIASVIPCSVRNPLTDRNYYWSRGNQINKTQGGFSGKLLNGDYNVFYENKNLKESGIYKKGLKSGTWKYWNPEGRLTNKTNFKDGFKHGLEATYDSLGNVKEKIMYFYGQYHGERVKFLGDSVDVKYYKHGIVEPQTTGKRKKISFLHL